MCIEGSMCITISIAIIAVLFVGYGIFRTMIREKDGNLMLLIGLLCITLAGQSFLLDKRTDKLDSQYIQQKELFVKLYGQELSAEQIAERVKREEWEKIDSLKKEWFAKIQKQLSDIQSLQKPEKLEKPCIAQVPKEFVEMQQQLKDIQSQQDRNFFLTEVVLQKQAKNQYEAIQEQFQGIQKQVQEQFKLVQLVQKQVVQKQTWEQEQFQKIQDEYKLAKQVAPYPLAKPMPSKEIRLLLKNNTIETVRAWDELCRAVRKAIVEQYNLPEDKNYTLRTTIDNMRFWLEEK
jgi:hypothetical protein